MWTTKSKIVFILYRITAAWLPISQRSRLAKSLRVFWARKMIRCGNAVNIEKNAYFTPGLSLGDNSGIGIDCEVYGPVTIGKNVMMGPEVVIYTSGHKFDRTDIPMIEQGSTDAEPVTIGDDVWIGRRVMIMPGVTIGNGCVIGAGAVATKDIPTYSVAGGVPARVLKTRDSRSNI
jgi:maltose O-acetyltransferase